MTGDSPNSLTSGRMLAQVHFAVLDEAEKIFYGEYDSLQHRNILRS